MKNPFLLKLYGRYFLYMELNRSSQILAAYAGDRLVGLLLASIYGKLMIFLAADPDNSRKGVGSLLLEELERRESGKEIFLYTDSNCTYQFYEKRGFERAAEKEILMELPDGDAPLICIIRSWEVNRNERIAK